MFEREAPLTYAHTRHTFALLCGSTVARLIGKSVFVCEALFALEREKSRALGIQHVNEGWHLSVNPLLSDSNGCNTFLFVSPPACLFTQSECDPRAATSLLTSVECLFIPVTWFAVALSPCLVIR